MAGENELVKGFAELCSTMTEKITKKNADYARGEDPFKNFRRHGPYGIVVRMDDKISRLDSLLRPGSDGVAQVRDESIEDTAMDLAAYALLLILTRRAMTLKVPGGDMGSADPLGVPQTAFGRMKL